MFADVRSPVHFIGIGGSGMSGLAELALKRGLTVQGSDLKPSKMTDRLTYLGALIHFGHHEETVKGAQTVVYSSAIAPDNVELLAGVKAGMQVMHRSEFLAWLMEKYHVITVAGTHGKSTTSAMIVHVLDALEQDPTAAVGGILRAYDSTAKSGSGPLFVAEADESDGSFLKYSPHIGVVTNIDLDHMEFYKSENGLVSAFTTYLDKIDADGYAIIGWDNALSRQVGTSFSGQRLAYGQLIGSDVRAINIHWNGTQTTFNAIVERDNIPVKLNAMGRHNVQNALCALAVTRALGLDVRKAALSLSNFSGVDRRMTLVHDAATIKIYDDYAHNPGKIEACVSALKESYPDCPLHVIYQPHRYSRLETMYDQMLASIKKADVVYVLPVYSAGETTTQDFSPEKLANDLVSRHQIRTIPCKNIQDAVEQVSTNVGPRGVILTVGAGDVYHVAYELRDVYLQPK
jgi:UDP-N-acetylmuramate--alanine ligase